MRQITRYTVFGMLCGAGLTILSGCDQAERLTSHEAAPKYSSCLLRAMVGNHNLTADDIRSLCAEATGATQPAYTWTDKELVPSNEFTRCYDKEKKELESKGVSQATRLAKLSCKYPDVK